MRCRNDALFVLQMSFYHSLTVPSSESSTDSEDSFTDLPPRRYQRKKSSNTNQTSKSGVGSGTATPSPAGPSVSSTGTTGESNEGANASPHGENASPDGATASPSSSASSKDKQKFPYNPPSPSLFSIYSQLPSPSSPTLNQPAISLVGSAPPPRSSPDLRRMVTGRLLCFLFCFVIHSSVM